MQFTHIFEAQKNMVKVMWAIMQKIMMMNLIWHVALGSLNETGLLQLHQFLLFPCMVEATDIFHLPAACQSLALLRFDRDGWKHKVEMDGKFNQRYLHIYFALKSNPVDREMEELRFRDLSLGFLKFGLVFILYNMNGESHGNQELQLTWGWLSAESHLGRTSHGWLLFFCS